MSTDLFTVRPSDLVDLTASVMDWRHVQHVPVEDDQGHLVGRVYQQTINITRITPLRSSKWQHMCRR